MVKNWEEGRKEMNTELLPPKIAVQMVWSLTERFHKEGEPKISADKTESLLTDILNQATGDEKHYVERTMTAMYATLRSLDTIYRGRELNFKENEQLRQTYLDAIQSNIEFGTRVTDYLKTIPTMVLGSTGATALVENYLKIVDIKLLTICGLFFAAFFFFIHFSFVWLTRDHKLKNYVAQDYERNLYYVQYLHRISKIFLNLYDEINQIHFDIFGSNYPEKNNSNIIERFKELYPTFCPYIYKHMNEKKIKPWFWVNCETGLDETTEKCPAFPLKK
jgi:hypothetical protein